MWELPTASLTPESSTFVGKKGAREAVSPIRGRPGKFTLCLFFFLCIWCQSLFFRRVLFILFPKDSTLRRGESLDLQLFCRWCFTDSKTFLKMWICIMCFFLFCFFNLLEQECVPRFVVLPSREGKQAGLTASARTRRTARLSTTARRHTEPHASLGTPSALPAERRTSGLSSLDQSDR